MNKLFYDLQYVKGKRTVSITVRDGAVAVRAPKGVKAAEIERIVEQKSAWIEKKLSEQAEEHQNTLPFTEYARFLLFGETYRAPQELREALERAAGKTDGGRAPRDDLKSLVKPYKAAALPVLRNRLSVFAQQFGFGFGQIKLINSRVKWGSCESGGTISLNWRLILLPPALIDYVIIHELCHLKHMNHSAAFWGAVALRCPNFKARKKEMRSWRFAIRLFR
ncbi:hypothetical protein FACS1894211_09820 [Clostridia bacterium]|nr:hypothetical protein FACS1894211_09820 [Clostridia bacterium]